VSLGSGGCSDGAGVKAADDGGRGKVSQRGPLLWLVSHNHRELGREYYK